MSSRSSAPERKLIGTIIRRRGPILPRRFPRPRRASGLSDDRPPPRAAVPLSAALLIVVAVALFSCTEAIVKILTQRYPVPLLLWARFAVQASIMVVLFAPAMGTKLVRSPQFGLQVWRGLALIASSGCYYFALRRLPLADAIAIIYTHAGVRDRAVGRGAEGADDASRAPRSLPRAFSACC